MQFKNALVGAVVGAAIGVAVLVAAYFLFGTEHVALAIVVALLVGMGVRAKVATKGHASYVRGALTALLAIAAFVGGKFIVAEIAVRQMTANAEQPVRLSTSPPKLVDRAATDASGGSDETTPEVEVPRQAERLHGGDSARATPRLNQAFSIGDFIWLTVAALLAYELGRGSGSAAPAGQTVPTTPA